VQTSVQNGAEVSACALGFVTYPVCKSIKKHFYEHRLPQEKIAFNILTAEDAVKRRGL